jgi:hypothetical protein
MGARDFWVLLKGPFDFHKGLAVRLRLGGVAPVKNSRRLD